MRITSLALIGLSVILGTTTLSCKSQEDALVDEAEDAIEKLDNYLEAGPPTFDGGGGGAGQPTVQDPWTPPDANDGGGNVQVGGEGGERHWTTTLDVTVHNLTPGMDYRVRVHDAVGKVASRALPDNGGAASLHRSGFHGRGHTSRYLVRCRKQLGPRPRTCRCDTSVQGRLEGCRVDKHPSRCQFRCSRDNSRPRLGGRLVMLGVGHRQYVCSW